MNAEPETNENAPLRSADAVQSDDAPQHFDVASSDVSAHAPGEDESHSTCAPDTGQLADADTIDTPCAPSSVTPTPAEPGVLDNAPDAEPVGYKRPPKKHRFKAGKSGNPSGKPKRLPASLGNQLEGHRQDLLDEIVRLMALNLVELQIQRDDSIITALAKSILSDSLKKDGTFRKFIMEELVRKALLSDRLRTTNPAAADAEMLQALMRAAIDPAISDREALQAMDRAAARRETTDEFLARRKKRRKRRKPSAKK